MRSRSRLETIVALVAIVVLSPATAAPTFTGGRGTKSKLTQSTAGLSLTGNLLAPGYELMPNMIDFGDLPFDTTIERTFCIVNTSSFVIEILSPISIVPAAGTLSGELSVVRIRKSTTCDGTSTQDRSLPEPLNPGELLEVTVRADPVSRVGLMQATLTVTSDLDTNPTRTLHLRANSTSDALTLTPSSLIDFKGVDVQGQPVSETITITNTSGGTLYLTNFQRTPDPELTIALPGDKALNQNESVNIPVLYKPVVAAPLGSEETVTVTYDIGGVINGPARGTIIIRGRGIDRVLELAPPPTFPSTFRNPGDLAPVRAVTVRNLGEATLTVSAVMIDDLGSTWQLVDAAPADIPKDASHDFLVRFAPMAAGPVQAKLVIVNDDSDQPMASVDLVGMGVNRNVQFGPDAIQLGYTGVGVPVTINNALAVTSKDPDNTFLIRAIELDQASLFRLEGFTPGLELAPMAEHKFGITYTAPKEGAFTAKARLYLDMDPLVHQEITLEGTAVFVDAHGNGCRVAGGSRGAAGGAVLLLAALLGLRRARPRPRTGPLRGSPKRSGCERATECRKTLH
jgi:hypothetical protein